MCAFRAAGLGDFFGGAAGAGLTESLSFAETEDVLLATGTPFSTVSPGSGGAPGYLKKTGSRMETGTGEPLIVAGANFKSRDPFTAAESRALNPEVSATCVDSGTMRPSRLMKIRRMTFP